MIILLQLIPFSLNQKYSEKAINVAESTSIKKKYADNDIEILGKCNMKVWCESKTTQFTCEFSIQDQRQLLQLNEGYIYGYGQKNSCSSSKNSLWNLQKSNSSAEQEQAYKNQIWLKFIMNQNSSNRFYYESNLQNTNTNQTNKQENNGLDSNQIKESSPQNDTKYDPENKQKYLVNFQNEQQRPISLIFKDGKNENEIFCMDLEYNWYEYEIQLCEIQADSESFNTDLFLIILLSILFAFLAVFIICKIKQGLKTKQKVIMYGDIEFREINLEKVELQLGNHSHYLARREMVVNRQNRVQKINSSLKILVNNNNQKSCDNLQKIPRSQSPSIVLQKNGRQIQNYSEVETSSINSQATNNQVNEYIRKYKTKEPEAADVNSLKFLDQFSIYSGDNLKAPSQQNFVQTNANTNKRKRKGSFLPNNNGNLQQESDQPMRTTFQSTSTLSSESATELELLQFTRKNNGNKRNHREKK